MELAVTWFILCFIVGIIASNNSRSGLGYFVLSVIISPLIGAIVVVALGKNKENEEKDLINSGELKPCPLCAENIKTDAKFCRYCKNEI